MKRNKFGAKKTTIDGLVFDSKWEGATWCNLKIRERVGEIIGLQRQIPFDLIVNGHHVTTYVADFVWTETATGERVVADAKSPATLTPEFRIKAKLLEALHGIVIQPIMSTPAGNRVVSWRRIKRPASPKTSKRGSTSLARS